MNNLTHQDSINIQRRNYRLFFIITIAWCLIWFLLPTFLLQNTYIDILENLVWGRHFQFGYDKNPYVGAWITRLGYIISGHQIWSAYLLSQISLFLGFFAIWKLGRKLLPSTYALLAVIFLIGIQFYGRHTPEFNDNVIEISTWALTCLFFYNALTRQKIVDWCLTGLLAGLAFMDKYYGGALYLPMCMILIATQPGRQSFKQIGLYLAGLIFVALSLPNFIWLAQHQFIAFQYALTRAHLSAGVLDNFWDHIQNPLRYLSSMLGVFLPPMIVLALCFWQRAKPRIRFSRFNWQYIIILTVGPLLCTMLFSALTGGKIKYMWNTPIFNLLGIFTLMIWQPKLTKAAFWRYGIITVLVALFWIYIYCSALLISPYRDHKGSYETFPGKAMSAAITTMWHKQFNTPIKYVAGNRELSCNFAIYSLDKPEAYFSESSKLSPWIKQAQLRKEGAVFLWQGHSSRIPTALAIRYPNLKLQPTQYFPRAVHNWATHLKKFKQTKIPPVQINIAFLPPESDRSN